MPYKRAGSPFYQIRLRLPGGIRTPVLSTKVRSKRVARHMERVLEQIAELAIVDPSYADVLDAVMTREVDLPTLAKAHRRGEVTRVRLLVANPLLSEVVARHLETERERGARYGYNQLLEVAPEGARLSWARSPQNIERALHAIQTTRNQKPNSVLRRAGQATRKLLRREFGIAECDRIWREVQYKKVDDSRRVNLSVREIHRILEACAPVRFRTFILAMMFTSADRGVLLNVRRRDLSVFVEKGRYEGTIYLEDTKTSGRSRTVGLGHVVAKALADEAIDKLPDELVFDYGYHYVGKKWREVRLRAGFPDLRMKDLRHVFAGLGLDTDGVSLVALKGGMGHSKLSTTMRYADRDVSFNAEHARLIEQAVFGETG